jgi:hypothetical protein
LERLKEWPFSYLRCSIFHFADRRSTGCRLQSFQYDICPASFDLALQSLNFSFPIHVLERYVKRAKRRFMLSAAEDEFRKLPKEWQSHLRWIQFRLNYFKPWSSCLASR